MFLELKLLDRLNEIRSRSYDIIVDLSGWTGGNFIAGLNARLAPVQVNYLGYFASSGLSSMDYWLGDSKLFPPKHSEWATESFLGCLALSWLGPHESTP